MHAKVFLSVLFTCFGLLLLAQPIRFNWQTCLEGYEGEDLDVNPRSIVKAEGGYLLVTDYEKRTWRNGLPSTYDVIWLVKLDENGNFLWDKFFSTRPDTYCGANYIVASADGYYYLFGGTAYDGGDVTYDPYPNSLDFWVIKVDGNGNKVWDKIVGGNGAEPIYGGGCYAAPDGGIVFLSTTTSSDGDVSQSFGAYDVWMAKLDKDGNKIWDFTAGTEDFEYGYAMIPTSDKGFLIGSSATPTTGGNITCTPYNSYAEAVILKLDSNRNIIWQDCLGGSDHDGARALLETNDGYLLGLTAYSNDGDIQGAGYHYGFNHLGRPTSDLWLRKVDYNGNLIWQRCYGGSKNEYGLKLFNLSDGNIMAFAQVESEDGDVKGFHPGGWYLEDIWMLKIDGKTGEILGQRCIGGGGNEYTEDGIIQLSDRDYVLAAFTQHGMQDDIACGPYPSVKRWAWVFSISDTSDYLGVPNLNEWNNYIKLYPNPAQDYITLDISHKFDLCNSYAEIFNSVGKTIKTVQLSSNKPYVYTGDLPSGMYLLKLKNKAGYACKKFIVKD